MPAPILSALGAVLARIGSAVVTTTAAAARVGGTAIARGATAAAKASGNALSKQAAKNLASRAARAAAKAAAKAAGGAAKSPRSPFARYLRQKAVKFANRAKRGIKAIGSRTGLDIGHRLHGVYKSWQKYRAALTPGTPQRNNPPPPGPPPPGPPPPPAPPPNNPPPPGPPPPPTPPPAPGPPPGVPTPPGPGQGTSNRKQALQELDDAISRMKSACVRLALSLIIPTGSLTLFAGAVRKLGEANLDAIRTRAGFSGRIANAVTKYDVAENRRQFRSAAATAATSEKFAEALNKLADAMQPLRDFSINVINVALTQLVKAATITANVVNAFLPFLKDIFERIAGKQPVVAPQRAPLEQAIGNPRWKKKPPPPGF